MIKRFFGFVLLFTAMSPVSQAGLLPMSLTVTKDAATNGYRFTYSVELQSKAILKPGDYFTIYDFAGKIEGSQTQPANFTFSTSDVGPTPAQLSPKDDPKIWNVTWTYTGTQTITGDKVLGDFSVASVFHRTGTDDFTGQTHKLTNGHFNNNITDTEVPVPCGVPEPSSYLLAGLGALGFVGYGLYRRRMGASVAI